MHVLSTRRVCRWLLRVVVLVGVLQPFLVCAESARARQQRQALERLQSLAIVQREVMVPMRDGVKLATDIARPRGDERCPVVLVRTPYRKNVLVANNFVREGYAVAVQDCRGRFGSEGEWVAFAGDIDDGHDTIEWIAQQSWCNGKVGMVGGSYVGWTQLAAAMSGAPHLRCITPTVPPSDFSGGALFHGGALRQELVQGWMIGQSRRSQRVQKGLVPKEELDQWMPMADFGKWRWQLPLQEPGPLRLGGEAYIKYWRHVMDMWRDPDADSEYSPIRNAGTIRVPAFITAGFYDIFAQENLDLLAALRRRGGSESARKHSAILIGPWVHGVGRAAGDLNFPDARQETLNRQQQWLAHWLKGEDNGVEKWPAVRAYVMHEKRWLRGNSWPPVTKKERLYLQPGTLTSAAPTASESHTSFTYDPRSPAPTMGGNNLVLVKGARDHRSLARRDDVVDFLTEPLPSAVTVAGRVRAHLFVSTTAPDTDFTAMVVDVRPDGYRVNVQDGLVRLRYRRGRAKPEFVPAGEVTAVDILLWSTAYSFKQGHRIGLHVSSANFPRFDRHLNSADAPWAWTVPHVATNTVYHDAAHASVLELPVLAPAAVG